MPQRNHWEHVYSTRQIHAVGWYTPHLQVSLDWILTAVQDVNAAVIDAGGGASTLVDDLLEAGYRSITVLDISDKALSATKQRLGKMAELVTWLNSDVTSAGLPEQYYQLWHDRALFHFLTEPEQQRKYRDTVLKALKPGGYFIVGTFAPEAPANCSGLSVQRYSPDRLVKALGKKFELVDCKNDLHITPGAVEHMYLYCRFRKIFDKRSCKRILPG